MNFIEIVEFTINSNKIDRLLFSNIN